VTSSADIRAGSGTALERRTGPVDTQGVRREDEYFVTMAETLVGRRAGTSAREKAHELRAADPFGTVRDRILRRHSDERAWSKGATGERLVGWLLDRLPDRWHVFNDIPVGNRGANIDHLVVGPAGVFTVNTKNLSGAVVVTPRTIRVNGVRKDYLPKAVAEARRAARLLSIAVGRPVEVVPVLAIIAPELQIRQPPSDVLVGRPRGVKHVLLSRPPVLFSDEVRAIQAAAAKPSTWRDASSPR
jgi:nuclease-like protein